MTLLFSILEGIKGWSMTNTGDKVDSQSITENLGT